MSTRQVLLAAIIVGIVGGLMAWPWLLCIKFQSACPRADSSDPSSQSIGPYRFDGKTFEQWQACWARELKPERRAEVFRAMAVLGTHGHGKDAAGTVIEMVKDRCREVGSDCLLDERDLIYREAAAALVEIGQPSSLVLLECCKDTARNVRHFGQFVKKVKLDPAAVPVLVKMAYGDNQEGSALALQTLGSSLQSTPRPTDVEAALLETVKKPKHRGFIDALQQAMVNDQTRLPAVAILRSLGPVGQPALKPLLQVVRQEVLREGRHRISPPADADLCLMLEALGKIQGEPGQVVPMLTRIATDKTEQFPVRRAAVRALTDFGPQAASATGALLDGLEDSIRCEALSALGKLETPPGQVVPRLVQAVARVVDAPLATIEPVEEGVPPAPPTLGASSASPFTLDFCKCSLDYLGKVGPAAKDAAPVLVRMARRFAESRTQVAEVLDKIGPTARPEGLRFNLEPRGGVDAKSSARMNVPDSSVKPVGFSQIDAGWKPADQENQGKATVPFGEGPNVPVMPNLDRQGEPDPIRQPYSGPSFKPPQPFTPPSVLVPAEMPSAPLVPPTPGFTPPPPPQYNPSPRPPEPLPPDMVPPPQ